VLVVKEETIARATSRLLMEEKIVAEPSSAVGIAALMEQPQRFAGKKVAVVISGGNLDERLIKEFVNA
jgi:threonine dehydratase